MENSMIDLGITQESGTWMSGRTSMLIDSQVLVVDEEWEGWIHIESRKGGVR